MSLARKLGIKIDLKGLTFSAGAIEPRQPFAADWIRDRLLAPGALDGLNLEARVILLGMVNTGYRPSEAQGLLAHHIRLEATVPHISIEPEGRTLKTETSKRVIPLTGVSLEAFRHCPEGFPRYRDNRTLSATVNKYLREKGLLPSADHTMYGLRHSFEDRLLAASVDPRIRCYLMGHALDRQRYGAGASLEMAHAILCTIAL